MKKILLIAIMFLLCSACERDSHKQVAVITYEQVQRRNENLYTIYFKSDIDVLTIFDRSKGDGAEYQSFDCLLANEGNPNSNPPDSQKLSGFVEYDHPNDNHHFIVDALYYDSFSFGSSRRFMSGDDPVRLLRQRKNLTCVMYIKSMLYKPYRTKTMLIPTADLIREIEKPLSKDDAN